MRIALTMIIAALASALSATARAAEPAAKDVEFLRQLIPKLAVPLELTVSKSTQDCRDVSICRVDIELTLVTSGGVEYCVTQMPKELKFNQRTLVVWTLATRSLPAGSPRYTFEFQDSGIITLLNHAQMGSGGFGMGGSSPLDKWRFNRWNLHPTSGTTVYVPYLPIILQNSLTNPLDIGVCAVGDPRIVNEP